MAIANNFNNPPPGSDTKQHDSFLLEAQIISQTPGRVRLRVLPIYRQPQKIAALINALQARGEICRLKTNIPSGSITVLYSRELLDSQEIINILQNFGIKFLKNPEYSQIATAQPSSAAIEVIQTAKFFNQQVKTATNDLVDLRFLFPLALGTLALRQLIVRGWQLDLIPWYVLAWYTFDSFLKLNADDKYLAQTKQ